MSSAQCLSTLGEEFRSIPGFTTTLNSRNGRSDGRARKVVPNTPSHTVNVRHIKSIWEVSVKHQGWHSQSPMTRTLNRDLSADFKFVFSSTKRRKVSARLPPGSPCRKVAPKLGKGWGGKMYTENTFKENRLRGPTFLPLSVPLTNSSLAEDSIQTTLQIRLKVLEEQQPSKNLTTGLVTVNLDPRDLFVPFKRLLHHSNVIAARDENGYVIVVRGNPGSSTISDTDTT